MIYVHIGTHKTGSKSLQLCLADRTSELHEAGYSLFRGSNKAGTNHSELMLATLDDGRDSFSRIRFPQSRGAAYTEQVQRHVHSFLDNRETPHAIFTNEDLCLLRRPAEMRRLRTLLRADREPVRLVLCLRDKSDFLRSYTGQIHKVPGRVPSNDRRSALYVGPDSWLVDYDALVTAFADAFGRENLAVIDYDTAIRNRGNVVPACLEALGLERLAAQDCSEYYIHCSNSPATTRRAA